MAQAAEILDGAVAKPGWREFNKVDWYGYAGAELYENGDEPLLADIKVQGYESVAILDARGAFIQVLTEDGIDVAFATASPDRNDGWTARWAALLKAEYTFEELEKAGFEIDYQT